MEVIYALIDPTDNMVKYVGRSRNVYERFIHHLKCCGNNEEKNGWIASLRSRGIVPILFTVEIVYGADAASRESYWIAHYLSLGMPLFNVAIKDTESKYRCESGGKLGRGYTEQGVKELFDIWFATGSFPDFVSVRMKNYYKQHYIRKDGKLHWKFLNMRNGYKKSSVSK